MTAREMRKVCRAVTDDTEITVGKFKIKRIVRQFAGKKMQLCIVPDTILISAPGDTGDEDV